MPELELDPPIKKEEVKFDYRQMIAYVDRLDEDFRERRFQVQLEQDAWKVIREVLVPPPRPVAERVQARAVFDEFDIPQEDPGWDIPPRVKDHLEREDRKRKEKDEMKMKAGKFEITVAQYMGTRSPDGMFGVEIEVEGEKLPEDIPFFKDKADGSLRGEGREYVFAQPLSFADSMLALSEFEKEFKGVKVDMSFRTSVHVHVNVSKLNKMQLCTYLYLVYLVENALVNYCGPQRVGNRFCLRLIDAVNKVRELENAFTMNGFRCYDQNRGKYSAINLACMAHYGSVEFRSMRGTVNRKEIETWLGILHQLFLIAKEFNTPSDVANLFLGIGAKEFAKKVFGGFYKDIDYPALEEEMHTNFSLLISLPYEEIKDFQ